MEITHAYAQSIVEKTMRILDYNINIMNSLGIIVGSGDKRRIDTYHLGAAETISSCKPMEFTSEQACTMEGVKPGVNLPIFLNNKIVGVVGITGEPKEVRPYGQLLKISVETMLLQFYLSEQLRMEQNAKELYISDIINGNFEEDSGLFIAKGEVLGYNMSLPRCAVVIKVYDFNSDPGKTSEVRQNAELSKQKRWEKTLNDIKMCFYNPEHMVSSSGSSNYVVLFALKDFCRDSIKKQVSEAVKIFREKVKEFHIDFETGVGSYYPGLSGLRNSYKEAVKVLQIHERITERHKSRGPVFAFDLGLEMMLGNTPKDILQIFINQVLSKVGATNFFDDSKLLVTLNTFFLCDLNISKTAGELEITRNTVGARLDKIKTITGMDPCNFNDAVKLKVIMAAREIG